MSYSELLKDPRWQKKRLTILQRDNFACCYCGDTEISLHVHHLFYRGKPWESYDDELITVCEDCHKVDHLNLTELERLLISCLRNRDGDDLGRIKRMNRVITRMKNG